MLRVDPQRVGLGPSPDSLSRNCAPTSFRSSFIRSVSLLFVDARTAECGRCLQNRGGLFKATRPSPQGHAEATVDRSRQPVSGQTSQPAAIPTAGESPRTASPAPIIYATVVPQRLFANGTDAEGPHTPKSPLNTANRHCFRGN